MANSHIYATNKIHRHPNAHRMDCPAGHTLLRGPAWMSPPFSKHVHKSPTTECVCKKRAMQGLGVGSQGEVTAPHPHPHTSHTPSLLSQSVRDGLKEKHSCPLLPGLFSFHPLLHLVCCHHPPPTAPRQHHAISGSPLSSPSLPSITHTCIYISTQMYHRDLARFFPFWRFTGTLEIRTTTDTPKMLSFLSVSPFLSLSSFISHFF